MRKIKFCLLFVSTVITVFSCSKDNNQNTPGIDAETLLTQKPWKLLSYGYDHNKNGVIDSNEEEIKDCESDNIYVFERNGSGVLMENERVCDGNEKDSHFNWSLIENDKVLDFIYATASVVKLTRDSLVIAAPNADPVKLLIIYTH